MIKRIESGIAGRGLKFDCLSSIRERAAELNLYGIVFLKNDGSIKIIAEGEEINLIQFAKKIERKFFFSSIDNFYVMWNESTREFKDFSIILNK